MDVKILFVDDEPDAELLIKQTFRREIRDEKYKFFFAHDGVEALDILSSNDDIEIILSDINMPRMDGLTLLNKVREMNHSVRETVIISAYGDMKNIRSAMNSGAYDFLTKPIDIKDLDLTLNKTIGHVKKLKFTINEKEKLRRELDVSQKEIIYKLTEVIEVRSRETGNHVLRVGEYSKLLALKSGIDAKEAEDIRFAATLHDIGKVAIPDAILNKPGKLTADEFNQMKTHTSIGFDLLKDSNCDVIKKASIISNQHHEKFNGQGYPEGLKSDNIHFYGRISAIADVFDALGSNRVYKKAWELDRILGLFKQERGEHFDPELTDLFFDNLDEIINIRDKYKD